MRVGFWMRGGRAMFKDTMLMDIDEQEKFIKNYQAVYYAMNAKPDCKSKIFPEDVTIDFADLNELNRKIVDKFKAHYEDAGFTINITVSFRDLTVVEFSSWATFSQYNFSLNTAIRGITIVWEYNAKLPKYSLPQKHTLTVRLADKLRPQDMMNLIFSGKLSEMDLVDQEFCSVVARVDFINSLLGDELLAIVDEWVEGISEADKPNKIMDFLERNKRKVAYCVNYITTFVAIMCGLKYLKFYLYGLEFKYIGDMSTRDFYDIMLVLTLLVVICIGINKMFFIIANIVFKALDKREEQRHTFNITKGDKKICKLMEKQQRIGSIKVLINLVITLIFNVFCSILANILTP